MLRRLEDGFLCGYHHQGSEGEDWQRQGVVPLSGGVDSSVAAVMLSKAIGKQLTCVFVDHGLLQRMRGRGRGRIWTRRCV